MKPASLLRLAAFLALFCLFLGASATAVSETDGLEAIAPWVRWLPAGLPAAGYVTLLNSSAADSYFVGASSRDYKKIELHQSFTAPDGASRMRPVRRLCVPAGGQVALAPGSYHLMLFEPQRKIEPGDTVTIELVFADGRCLPVSFSVKPANQHP